MRAWHRNFPRKLYQFYTFFLSCLCSFIMPLLPSRSLLSEHGTPSELYLQWVERRANSDNDSDSDTDSDSNSTSESHQHSGQTTRSQSTGSQTVGSQTGSHTTGSQTTGSQTAGSQATGSQANGSQVTRIAKHKSNAGAIAGGVITALAVLAFLLFIFVWRKRAARKNRPKVKLEIDPMSSLGVFIFSLRKCMLTRILLTRWSGVFSPTKG